MSVLVSDQDRGGDALARIAPSKTVKLSEYSKSRIDGVWRIADQPRRDGGEVAADRVSRPLVLCHCASCPSRANSISIPSFGLTFSQFAGISSKKWRYPSRDRRMRSAVDVPGERQPSIPAAHQTPPPIAAPKVNTISIHTAVATAFAQKPSAAH